MRFQGFTLGRWPFAHAATGFRSCLYIFRSRLYGFRSRVYVEDAALSIVRSPVRIIRAGLRLRRGAVRVFPSPMVIPCGRLRPPRAGERRAPLYPRACRAGKSLAGFGAVFVHWRRCEFPPLLLNSERVMVTLDSRKEERSNMAKNETRRIRPSALQEDRDAFAALKNMPGYKSAQTQFDVGAIQTLGDAMVAKRDTEAQKQADLDAARDDATAAEWEFHNGVLGAKDQVIAQFGDNSNEVQSLGLKKKSEYKSPTKAPGPSPAPSPAPPK
jgi:hypothetical protein